jgi:hypothetical protein
MKKIVFAAASIIVCFCMACSGSPQEPSEQNFTKALNAYLQKEGITIDIGDKFPIQVEIERISQPGQADTGPYKVPVLKRKPLKRPNSKIERYKALEQLGLLSSKEIEIERGEKLYWTEPSKMVKFKAIQYDLTDKGKGVFKEPDNTHTHYRFMIASASVDKIDNFTSPTPVEGYTISKVKYTFLPDKVQGWAKSNVIADHFPEIKDKLRKGQSDTATLVLMGSGWEDAQAVAKLIQ